MKTDDSYMELAWNNYNQRLLSYIRKRISSSQDAEDILSNVYLKLAQQTDLSRIPHKLPNWLFSVTNNAIIDFYRTNRDMTTLPDNLYEALPETDALLSLSECIHPFIEQLPETLRQPILLSQIHNKRHKVIADELGISLSAVKSRVLRGRKKLKELMAKRCCFHYNEQGQLIDYTEI